jgi:hypothetical protein
MAISCGITSSSFFFHEKPNVAKENVLRHLTSLHTNRSHEWLQGMSNFAVYTLEQEAVSFPNDKNEEKTKNIYLSHVISERFVRTKVKWEMKEEEKGKKKVY